MTKRKISLGGAIVCPACGEEFENGIDLDLHRVEAGPVCPDCGNHVDPDPWVELVGRVAPIKEADDAEEEAEEGEDEEECE